MQVASAIASTEESRAEDLRQAALDHVWFQSGTAWEDAVAPGGVKVMVEGKGCYITDIEGKTYLDFASGLWLAQVGYGRREIVEAMAAQAARLHYTRSTNPTVPTIRLAAKLAQLAPGSLSKCFFTSGGSESNEAALKMALQYHHLKGDMKRHKIIGRKLSYHGGTFATMSVGGSRMLNKAFFEPLLPGARLIPGPYCYHCDYGLEYPGCALRCAHELEQLILAEGPETVAAFIGEPVSNSSGVSVPPPDYWPTIRAICDRYGIILICDEVITGFGRTGKMFAVEHWGIVPDILTIAKGLTSGYAPMGAAIARAELAEQFKPGHREAFQHIVTFGGHAAASAAALANIEILERERLVEHAARMGAYLLDGLRQLAQHRSVGEVRGLGLMCAVELVKEKGTRAGFTEAERASLRRTLSRKFSEAGVYLLAGDKITLMPPLIVQRSEIDLVLELLDRSLSELEREAGWWN